LPFGDFLGDDASRIFGTFVGDSLEYFPILIGTYFSILGDPSSSLPEFRNESKICPTFGDVERPGDVWKELELMSGVDDRRPGFRGGDDRRPDGPDVFGLVSWVFFGETGGGVFLVVTLKVGFGDTSGLTFMGRVNFFGGVDWRGEAVGGGNLLVCFSLENTTRLGFGETGGEVLFTLERSKDKVVGRLGDRFKSSRSGESNTEGSVLLVTLPSRVGHNVSCLEMAFMIRPSSIGQRVSSLGIGQSVSSLGIGAIFLCMMTGEGVLLEDESP